MLDEMIQQNTTKFDKLYGYKKKQSSFLLFYFEEKKHKVFCKYKICQILKCLLDHFLKHKSLISEEWRLALVGFKIPTL